MNEKKVTAHPRRLARQMAKAELDRQHVTGYNKPTVTVKGGKGPSRFASNWTRIAAQIAARRPIKKGVKK